MSVKDTRPNQTYFIKPGMTVMRFRKRAGGDGEIHVSPYQSFFAMRNGGSLSWYIAFQSDKLRPGDMLPRCSMKDFGGYPAHGSDR